MGTVFFIFLMFAVTIGFWRAVGVAIVLGGLFIWWMSLIFDPEFRDKSFCTSRNVTDEECVRRVEEHYDNLEKEESKNAN